jgi:hypothetical protein
MSPDCEPVHIYSGSAGDFRGPEVGAAGTRYFEPDGVAFFDDRLTACAALHELPAVAGCASSPIGARRVLQRSPCERLRPTASLFACAAGKTENFADLFSM